MKKTKGPILVRFLKERFVDTQDIPVGENFGGSSSQEPQFSREMLASFSARKCASSILRASERSRAKYIYILRNAGRSVGGTFLKSGSFTKNSRLHVLKFRNQNPSKTLRAYQNPFFRARYFCIDTNTQISRLYQHQHGRHACTCMQQGQHARTPFEAVSSSGVPRSQETPPTPGLP